jgi:subtilisin family serine protease
MVPRILIRAGFTLTAVAGLILTIAAQTGVQMDSVLIHTAKPYTDVVARVQAAGGRVKQQYKYVDAVAADIPRGSEAALRQLAGVSEIAKDAMVSAPRAVNTERVGDSLQRTDTARAVESDGVTAIDAGSVSRFVSANPDAYLINDANMNVTPLLASGITGTGVIVALIDSGIRPGFPHIELDGSVIGGEDFVHDGRGFSNPANNGHGTFVAGMVSANVVFAFPSASVVARSISTHCPTCVFPGPPGTTAIPMLGSAPSASIYALRVFGPNGGSPTSRILEAVERVIELREKFDAGQAGGRNIQVCNMSLGGPTLFAGRDLLDTEVNVMLDRGIVLTASAGNAGPSSLTLGSPASAFEALAVGASSDAVHERIVQDLQYGLGIGVLFRPSSGTQTVYFSSRGPTADGRPDPDVVANGDWSFGQGFTTSTTGINFAGGTSFSAPTVAGIAALLRQAFPFASARQIRNAIVMGANPHVLADDSTELDQGEGYVDAKAAYDLLAAHLVPDRTEKPRHPTPKVANNVRHGTALEPLKGVVHERVEGLKPAERSDFVYQVDDKITQVVIQIANVTPGAAENVLFGDDIFLNVHSAKTSSIGEGDYVVGPLFTTGGTFVVNDPEPGLLRVTVSGDWTNVSPIAADVTIVPVKQNAPHLVTARGLIKTDQSFVYKVNIPAGASVAQFDVRWKDNWSHYPTSDIDLILIDPAAHVNFDGATLDSPEEVTVLKPAAGLWTVVVDGFDVPAKFDHFELRVAVDGNIIKP